MSFWARGLQSAAAFVAGHVGTIGTHLASCAATEHYGGAATLVTAGVALGFIWGC